MSKTPRVSMTALRTRLRQLRRFSLLFFIVFVACLYGFILFKAQTLQAAEPSEDVVTGLVDATKTPHIDPAVVKQLEALRDTSVNVQTLFDKARDDPFE